jgi:hypothetical protein
MPVWVPDLPSLYGRKHVGTVKDVFVLFTDNGGRITENTFTVYQAEFFTFFEGRRLPENTITVDCSPKKTFQVLTDNGELITVNGYCILKGMSSLP